MNATENRTKTFLGVRKLPSRYAGVVMPLLLSFLMTFIVSYISTWRGVGLSPDFARIWFGAWALSWLVAFPVLLAVLPLVRRATAAIVDANDRHYAVGGALTLRIQFLRVPLAMTYQLARRLSDDLALTQFVGLGADL